MKMKEETLADLYAAASHGHRLKGANVSRISPTELVKKVKSVATLFAQGVDDLPEDDEGLAEFSKRYGLLEQCIMAMFMGGASQDVSCDLVLSALEGEKLNTQRAILFFAFKMYGQMLKHTGGFDEDEK